MKSLTKKQQESYENAKIFDICNEKFENKYWKDKKYCKIRDHFPYTGEYRGAAHSICNLKISLWAYIVMSIVKKKMPKKMSIVFHNRSNYDYHFTIKELAEEFKKQFICLEENTEKCITLTVLIEKKVARIDKNGEEIMNIEKSL